MHHLFSNAVCVQATVAVYHLLIHHLHQEQYQHITLIGYSAVVFAWMTLHALSGLSSLLSYDPVDLRPDMEGMFLILSALHRHVEGDKLLPLTCRCRWELQHWRPGCAHGPGPLWILGTDIHHSQAGIIRRSSGWHSMRRIGALSHSIPLYN